MRMWKEISHSNGSYIRTAHDHYGMERIIQMGTLVASLIEKMTKWDIKIATKRTKDSVMAVSQGTLGIQDTL